MAGMVSDFVLCLQVIQFLWDASEQMKDNEASQRRLCRRGKIFEEVLKSYQSDPSLLTEALLPSVIELKVTLLEVQAHIKENKHTTLTNNALTRFAFRKGRAGAIGALDTRLTACAVNLAVGQGISAAQRREEDLEDLKSSFESSVSAVLEEVAALQELDQATVEMLVLLKADIAENHARMGDLMAAMNHTALLTAEECAGIAIVMDKLSHHAEARHKEVMTKLAAIESKVDGVQSGVKDVHDAVLKLAVSVAALTPDEERVRADTLKEYRVAPPGSILVQFNDLIGMGGFGSVYAGKYHGTRVAVKIITGDAAKQKEAENEVLMMKRLSSPLILGCYGYDIMNNRVSIVMDFACYKSLDVVIDYGAGSGIPFPVPLQLAWMRDLGAALRFIHSKGIKHRDVKPANMMVVDKFHIKLSDFGSSKQHSAFHTVGGVVGTLAFMAPEVRQGQPSDFAADIYSWAASSINILTRLVAEVLDDVSAHSAHMQLEARAAGMGVEESKDLVKLLQDCLRYDANVPPNDIRPTAQEVLRRLDEILLANGGDPREMQTVEQQRMIESLEKRFASPLPEPTTFVHVSTKEPFVHELKVDCTTLAPVPTPAPSPRLITSSASFLIALNASEQDNQVNDTSQPSLLESLCCCFRSCFCTRRARKEEAEGGAPHGWRNVVDPRYDYALRAYLMTMHERNNMHHESTINALHPYVPPVVLTCDESSSVLLPIADPSQWEDNQTFLAAAHAQAMEIAQKEAELQAEKGKNLALLDELQRQIREDAIKEMELRELKDQTQSLLAAAEHEAAQCAHREMELQDQRQHASIAMDRSVENSRDGELQSQLEQLRHIIETAHPAIDELRKRANHSDAQIKAAQIEVMIRTEQMVELQQHHEESRDVLAAAYQQVLKDAHWQRELHAQMKKSQAQLLIAQQQLVDSPDLLAAAQQQVEEVGGKLKAAQAQQDANLKTWAGALARTAELVDEMLECQVRVDAYQMWEFECAQTKEELQAHLQAKLADLSNAEQQFDKNSHQLNDLRAQQEHLTAVAREQAMVADRMEMEVHAQIEETQAALSVAHMQAVEAARVESELHERKERNLSQLSLTQQMLVEDTYRELELQQYAHNTASMSVSLSNIGIQSRQSKVEVIIARMLADRNSIASACEGCCALFKIAAGSAENKAIIVKAGGIDAVVAVVLANVDDETVVEQGCGLLWTLASNAVTRNAIVAASRGIIDMLLAAVRTHTNNASIAGLGCVFLDHLASIPMQRAGIGRAGIEAIISVLRFHELNAGIVMQGCGALWQLATDSNANQAIIANAGGVELIVALVRAHLEQSDVVEKGCGALWALSGSAKNSINAAGGVVLLKEVLRMQSADATIKAVAERTLTNLA